MFHWTMSLQLEDEQYVTGASEVSMSWNIDNLPEHIELTLTDNLTGDVVDLNNELDYTFTTEPKEALALLYQDAVGIYPLFGDARFTLHTSYGALDNEHEVALPSVYALDPVYPNPFNPRTTVRFDVPEVSRVELEVYDITGSLVETLLDQKMVPGGHQYSWEPKESIDWGIFFKAAYSEPDFYSKSHIREIGGYDARYYEKRYYCVDGYGNCSTGARSDVSNYAYADTY